jgi:hypothetical protein
MKVRAMPIYFFNLKTPEGTIRDPVGTDLPDESSAREHARLVACELMQHRPPRTRSWRIDVCDGEGRRCLDMLFASVDESISGLPPELRNSIENLHAKHASLSEAINAIRLTIFEVKGTIARSERAPYIAAVNGVAVDDRAGAGSAV